QRHRQHFQQIVTARVARSRIAKIIKRRGKPGHGYPPYYEGHPKNPYQLIALLYFSNAIPLERNHPALCCPALWCPFPGWTASLHRATMEVSRISCQGRPMIARTLLLSAALALAPAPAAAEPAPAKSAAPEGGSA